MEKLLSIIIPSYNMEQYLSKCLDSVLSDESDREKLEVIVVNDGSKDRTSEIAHGYAERYPAVVRVIDKPNGHYGSAVNAGLKAATGRYVKILDADDTFDSDGLAALLAQIESDETAGIAVDLYLTPFAHVDAQGTVTDSVTYALPNDRIFGMEEILSKTREIAMHACAWRMERLRDIGYRQTEGIAYSDVEWILYPMLNTRTVRYLQRSVYRYWFGREGQSVSLVERRKNINAWEHILGRILSTIRLRGPALLPAAREYLLRVAVDMSRMYSESVFVLRPIGDAANAIPKLLTDLEAVQPGLSGRLEDEARILKGTLNIPYLRIWRRLPAGKTVWMRLVRGYLAITRWIK